MEAKADRTSCLIRPNKEAERRAVDPRGASPQALSPWRVMEAKADRTSCLIRTSCLNRTSCLVKKEGEAIGARVGDCPSTLPGASPLLPKSAATSVGATEPGVNRPAGGPRRTAIGLGASA